MARKLSRLYVNHSLFLDACLEIEGQIHHYLTHVLRLKLNDELLIFNGTEGEWQAKITSMSKKSVILKIHTQTRVLENSYAVSLYFSPLKSGPTSFLMEKATELGVTDLHPLWMARTQGRLFPQERWQNILQEAAEQCERLTVPCLHPPLSLDELLTQWNPTSPLWICDESRTGLNLFTMLQESLNLPLPLSFIVGPEGGFTEEERAQMSRLPNAQNISLGPQVLRAETAALNALALMHTFLGAKRSK